jgi:hypothetical protein
MYYAPELGQRILSYGVLWEVVSYEENNDCFTWNLKEIEE